MNRRTFFLLGTATALIGGCAPSKFKHYRGPEVTRVIVNKGQRKMYLLHQNDVLEAYDIDLGFAPVGDKKIEGDGKTPEGHYVIDRRNPASLYHLSLGISYPNVQDRREAERLGRNPGGDIFIHGNSAAKRDWTAGCIAVTDAEMEDIYAMVDVGTPIWITP